MNDALGILNQTQALHVRQKKEWGEILSGWETKNRYEISDENGRPILLAGETSRGMGGFLLRQWLGRRRPFTIEVRDLQGRPVLTIRRPWRWILARAEIYDAQDRLLGAVQQHFTILTRQYTLEDATSMPVAQLHGPLFRPWTFHILVNGTECGAIRKKWSGLMKEALTDADHFSVEFSPDFDWPLRAVCLGATFLADFVYFERSR